tara:strand:+ start:145 stop:309 length:165 start_codon:yes stop_codon:yes gene_type:complete
MDKRKHTYKEDLILGAEYKYDAKHKKVYNIKAVKRQFNIILESLKNKNNGKNNE